MMATRSTGESEVQLIEIVVGQRGVRFRQSLWQSDNQGRTH